MRPARAAGLDALLLAAGEGKERGEGEPRAEARGGVGDDGDGRGGPADGGVAAAELEDGRGLEDAGADGGDDDGGERGLGRVLDERRVGQQDDRGDAVDEAGLRKRKVKRKWVSATLGASISIPSSSNWLKLSQTYFRHTGVSERGSQDLGVRSYPRHAEVKLKNDRVAPRTAP